MRLYASLAAFALALPALADDAGGQDLAPAPAGAYAIDKAHTSLTFRVNHLGFSSFTGRFTKIDAQLAFDPRQIAKSTVNVTIDPASIQTDNAPDGFLAMLAGDNWLEADKYPRLSFRSLAIEPGTDGNFRIRGELTLHGVTKPLTLDARYNGGYAGHPYEPNARAGFSAHGTFKRSEFGVSVGVPTAAMKWGVSDRVDVQLETEFTGPPLKTAQR